MRLSGEESNYDVLVKVLRSLKRGGKVENVTATLEEFLKTKRRVETRIEELTIKARHGDKEAARELIQEMANMNDGV